MCKTQSIFSLLFFLYNMYIIILNHKYRPVPKNKNKVPADRNTDENSPIINSLEILRSYLLNVI